MNIGQAIKMSAKSIFANKGRSLLTMLGIIIGLAAVIILVSYARGQNVAIQRYYESTGKNLITLESDVPVDKDLNQFLNDYVLKTEHIVGISPNGKLFSYPVIKYGSKTLSRDSNSSWNGFYEESGRNDYPTLSLGNEQFALCHDYTIEKGRNFSYLDIKNGNQVCILGAATAQYLFNFSNPIGQTITVQGIPFRVIGVFQSKGGNSSGGESNEFDWIQDSIDRLDRLIVFPFKMNRYLNDNQPIGEFVIKVDTLQNIPHVIANLESVLQGYVGNSFFLYSEDIWQSQSDEATRLQQSFLGGIAAISLLVGGIGIMNIMLVTVTERTREIGIRKAIGAERSSIIIQFLIEAAMICGIGGLFGIALGYIGTLIIGKLSFNIILFPSLGITLGSAVISVALGIIFGLYPAIKASGLQPVVALRAD